MRPSHDPAMGKAGLAFRSEPLAYDRRDPDEQRRACRHGSRARVGSATHCSPPQQEADDFYFDAFAQVHMATVSQGRVALVGDAGYCASPLSGMGTSLALVGAYVLAGELGPRIRLTPKDQGALPRYESVMRPYIDRCQDLPNGIDGYLPKSARHRHHRPGDEVDAALAVSPARRREVFTTADAIDLPDYSAV